MQIATKILTKKIGTRKCGDQQKATIRQHSASNSIIITFIPNYLLFLLTIANKYTPYAFFAFLPFFSIIFLKIINNIVLKIINFRPFFHIFFGIWFFSFFYMNFDNKNAKICTMDIQAKSCFFIFAFMNFIIENAFLPFLYEFLNRIFCIFFAFLSVFAFSSCDSRLIKIK